MGLLGPNKSGKTTLLRAIGDHIPYQGHIRLNGRSVSDWSDRSRVRKALSIVDLEGFSSRFVLSLSGGELQRVFLAQALVQEANLLLLDESTAHLDVHYHFTFMEQVQALVQNGRTVLAVFHDLELAARCADRLLVLDEGRLVAGGAAADVLTPTCIAEVFGMRARTHHQPDGRLRIDYLGPICEQEKGPENGESELDVVSLVSEDTG